MDAFQDWSPTDYGLLGTTGLAIYADNQTTKDAIKRGAKEKNPIFGTGTPSNEALDAASIASGVGVAGAALVLPKQAGRDLLAGVTGIESTLAVQNSSKGKGVPTTFEEGILVPLAVGAISALASHFAGSGVEPYIEKIDGKPMIGLRVTKQF